MTNNNVKKGKGKIAMNKKTYLFAITKDADRSNTTTQPYIEYLTYNEGKWKAVYQEGEFTHSREGGAENSHKSDRLDYLEPGGRKWRLFIEDGKCVSHAVSGCKETRKAEEIHFVGWDKEGYTASLTEFDGDASKLTELLKNAITGQR